jgi:hypothetical protein
MRKRTGFYLALGLIVAVTAAGRALCSRLGGGQSALLTRASEGLKHVPREIGPWRCVFERPLDEGDVQMLHCAGYVSRSYVHTQTRSTVNVTLLVGPAGPLVAHRAEFCVPSRGWIQLGDPVKFQIAVDGQGFHEFFQADFEEQSVSGRRSRIYYAWNRGGRWEAPSSPRIALGGSPGLFKLQVDTAIDVAPAAGNDPAAQFVKDLLPALEQVSLPQTMH